MSEKDSLGKCSVCGEKAGVSYPLLPGEPAFCSGHHNPKDAGPFGCDFTGPDDFDIPFDDSDVPFADSEVRPFSEGAFVWKDKEGNKHKLKDIDDQYLQNIINHLRRRLPEMSGESANYWRSVVGFLVRVQKQRVVRR